MNHPEITWNPYFPSSFPMFCVSPLFPYFSWSMVNPRLRYNRYPRLPQFHGSRKTPSQYIGLIHAKDCSGSFISLCISIYLSESIYLWIYFSVYLSIYRSIYASIYIYIRTFLHSHGSSIQRSVYRNRSDPLRNSSFSNRSASFRRSFGVRIRAWKTQGTAGKMLGMGVAGIISQNYYI